MIRSKNQAYKAWPIHAKRNQYENKRRLTDKLPVCRKKKRLKLNEHLLRITEEFNENDLHKALRMSDHMGKILNHQQSCARMCRVISLEIVQTQDKDGRNILKAY
jgi:hypothetical protein